MISLQTIESLQNFEQNKIQRQQESSCAAQSRRTNQNTSFEEKTHICATSPSSVHNFLKLNIIYITMSRSKLVSSHFF